MLTAARDERGLGRAWLAVQDVHVWACRYGAAAEAARRASESYARASFSPALIDAALAFSLLVGPTHVRGAIAECRELREAAPDRLSEANVSTSLGALTALDGRFEDLRELLSHAREIYEDIGNRPLSTGSGARTCCSWNAGPAISMRRCRDRSSDDAVLRASGDRAYASTWAARLAEILYWSGRHEEAGRSVAAAREGAVVHDVYVQFLWRSTAAKLAAHEGRAEEADQLSTEALELAAASDSPLLLADLWVARAEVLRFGRESGQGRRGGRARAHAPAGEGRLGRTGRDQRLLCANKRKKAPSGLSV